MISFIARYFQITTIIYELYKSQTQIPRLIKRIF